MFTIISSPIHLSLQKPAEEGVKVGSQLPSAFVSTSRLNLTAPGGWILGVLPSPSPKERSSGAGRGAG